MVYTVTQEIAGERTETTTHEDFARALDLFFEHLEYLQRRQKTGAAILCENGKERLRAALTQ